jgi:predicted  nucleic acid-binding Zn-ribbon protein
MWCFCCVDVHLQLNDLKRALLDKEQLLQEYEYEKSQMQRRMEELAQRLADKSSSLDGSRSVSLPWVLK